MVITHILAGQGVFGGLEKHVVDLSAAQVRRGHRVYALTTASMGVHFSDTVEVLPIRLDRPRWDPRLRNELKKILLNIQPDVVHAHANKAAAVSGKLLRKMGLFSVATVQNVKKNQQMFAPFDRVIAASEIVAQSLAGIPSTVIRNSVAKPDSSLRLKAQATNPPFLEHKGKIIYAAGRFVEAKGYDLLLEAIRDLPEAYLWLVGDGPDRQKVQSIIDKECLNERVWLPGFLPVDQVLGLMQLADLFVVSSRREGGPYTLSEALRSRCPVVSTKVGFAPELLDEAQLCDSITASDISAKITSALQDAAGYAQSMQSVFDRADVELDLEYMVDKVMEVYALGRTE